VHRQAGVDDLVDEHDVAAVDLHVEVLEEADLLVPARLGEAVAGELDEIECVCDRDRAREVGDERDARLQRADEQRVVPVVVPRDLGAELPDARGKLVGVEVDLADTCVESTQDTGSFRKLV
jgi:hypothetical protein